MVTCSGTPSKPRDFNSSLAATWPLMMLGGTPGPGVVNCPANQVPGSLDFSLGFQNAVCRKVLAKP